MESSSDSAPIKRKSRTRYSKKVIHATQDSTNEVLTPAAASKDSLKPKEEVSDAELRKLNDKLREKENLIRKLTAAQAQSKVQTSAAGGGCASRDLGAQDARQSRRGRRETKRSNLVESVDDSSAISSKLDSSSSSRGKAAGILTIPGDIKLKGEPSNKISNSPKTSAPQPREGVDFPRRKPVYTPSSMLSHLQMSDDAHPGRQTVEKGKEDSKRIRLGQLESSMAKMLDEVKTSKQRVHDVCFLGLSASFPDVFRTFQDLERNYLADLTTESLPLLIQACSEKIPLKAWNLRQKLLELYQIGLSSSNENRISDSQLRLQASANYMDELIRSIEFIRLLLGHIEKGLGKFACPTNGYLTLQQVLSEDVHEVAHTEAAVPMVALGALQMSIEEISLRESAASLYISLGDVVRCKCVQLCSREFSSSGKRLEVDLTEPRQLYLKAKQYCPWFGSVFKSLSIISKYKRDMFECVYNLIRSFTTRVPYSGREILLEVFESIKSQASSLDTVTALSGLSFDLHMQRFSLHVLTCIGIAFCRVDADKFSTHMDILSRHLASAAHLLVLEKRSWLKQRLGYEKQTGKSFLDMKMVAIQHRIETVVEDEEFQSKIEVFNELVFKTIVMCMALLHTIGTKNELETVLNVQGTEDIFDKQHSPDQKDTVLKRFCSVKFQQIQRIPGFMDVGHLLLNIIRCVVGDQSVASSEVNLAAETLRSVSTFLEWLGANPAMSIFSLLDRSGWSTLENCLVSFLKNFPSLREDVSECFSPLPEDIDLCGFLPMKSVVDSRLFISSPMVSLTSDAQESIRLYRMLNSVSSLSSTVVAFKNQFGTATIQFDQNRQPFFPSESAHASVLMVLNLTTKKSQSMSGEVLCDLSGLQVTEPDLRSEEKVAVELKDVASLRGGILRVDVSTLAPPSSSSRSQRVQRTSNKSKRLPLVVVDASNVAMRHGLNAKFSCLGLKLALEYFKSAGHKVLSFLPDYLLSYEKVGEMRRKARAGVGKIRAASIPDDLDMLQQLVVEGYVIGTPPQDYDDSYCIEYARSHDGYVITNDLFRDYVEKKANSEDKKAAKNWISAHCISFTFVGDEFLPNPDATFHE